MDDKYTYMYRKQFYLSSFFFFCHWSHTHMLARAQVNQQLIVIVNLVLLSRGQALFVESLS